MLAICSCICHGRQVQASGGELTGSRHADGQTQLEKPGTIPSGTFDPMKVLMVSLLALHPAAGFTSPGSFRSQHGHHLPLKSRFSYSSPAMNVPEGRRAFIASAATLAASMLTVAPAYGTYCIKRTPLGACTDTAPGEAPWLVKPVYNITRSEDFTGMERFEGNPDGQALVAKLKARAEQNKVANERAIKEKTLKAGLAGKYGPFSTERPIVRWVDEELVLDTVTYPEFDRLNRAGVLTKTPQGLDTYVEGFDPLLFLAQEPPKGEGGGLFGLR